MSGREGAGSLAPEYFHDIYERNRDPWSFETSDYEKKKYEATLSALPEKHFKHALEIGCSIGVLTRLLAARCDNLLALDVSEKALATARARCHDLPQVSFQCLRVPQQMPEGNFDLVIVSEVAYYWSLSDLALAADRISAHQPVGACLLLVHLTEFVPDYPLTGDQVHDYWLQRPEWRHVHGEHFERFRIDVLIRGDA